MYVTDTQRAMLMWQHMQKVNCRWELWRTVTCGISEYAPIMRSISYGKAVG